MRKGKQPHPDQKSKVAKQKFQLNNISSRIAQPTNKERPPHSKKWMTCKKGERCPGVTDPTLNGQRRERRADKKILCCLIDKILKTTKPAAFNFGRGDRYRLWFLLLGNQMLTQHKPQSQVQAPKTWGKPTTQARVGDYIREPFQPIMVVADKDTLPDGRVWLLVKPVSASYTEEWIVEQEPAQPPQQQQPQLEKTEPIQPVGFAGDTVGVNLRLTHKAFATMAEWEEAANLIPPGYRIKNGWFCDSHGGRCNLPPTKLSPRQIDILMGALPVR